jgi:hypothetical protein
MANFMQSNSDLQPRAGWTAPMIVEPIDGCLCLPGESLKHLVGHLEGPRYIESMLAAAALAIIMVIHSVGR